MGKLICFQWAVVSSSAQNSKGWSRKSWARHKQRSLFFQQFSEAKIVSISLFQNSRYLGFICFILFYMCWFRRKKKPSELGQSRLHCYCAIPSNMIYPLATLVECMMSMQIVGTHPICNYEHKHEHVLCMYSTTCTCVCKLICGSVELDQ